MPKIKNEGRNQDDSAKQRILNAARELFAKKGYEGASIADIAKKAEVNKALPFYYFESKRKLLEALLSQDIEKVMDYRKSFMERNNTLDRGTAESIYEEMIEDKIKSKEILKIILMEMLTSVPEDTSIFEILDPIYSDLVTKIEALGGKVEDRKRLMTTSFFMSTVPIFMFITLGDKWAAHYGLDIQDMKRKFIQDFKRIFVNAQYDLYFSKKE